MIGIASYTAPGEGSDNEDAYEIRRHPTSHSICALADGRGGAFIRSSNAARRVAIIRMRGLGSLTIRIRT